MRPSCKWLCTSKKGSIFHSWLGNASYSLILEGEHEEMSALSVGILCHGDMTGLWHKLGTLIQKFTFIQSLLSQRLQASASLGAWKFAVASILNCLWTSCTWLAISELSWGCLIGTPLCDMSQTLEMRGMKDTSLFWAKILKVKGQVCFIH